MPLVSVIVPCYNEQATIGLLLEALRCQTFPLHEVEVIISDGLSTDHTREKIAAYQASNPDLTVRVIDNHKRNIPAGLNRALEAAGGTYIIRLDAHSVPYPDYVERCVSALEAGNGDNVGGVWEIRPSQKTWVAKAIAAAASHPFGVGDARYRFSNRAQVVETVPFGAFHRTVIERIGPFDESLLTNEDYEFNVRLRQTGGVVWMDPAIRSIYFARPNLRSLSRQYWRYGFWKARMIRRYPKTLRWRQLAALLVMSLVGLSALSIWFPLARTLLIVEITLYAMVLAFAGLQTSILNRNLTYLLGVPLAIATMHFSWGTAFLWSLIRSATYNDESSSGR